VAYIVWLITSRKLLLFILRPFCVWLQACQKIFSYKLRVRDDNCRYYGASAPPWSVD